LKRRAGFPLASAALLAAASWFSIIAARRGLRARPKRYSTRLASHQAIKTSRAKPESARSKMRTFGQLARSCATIRAISSTAPALASMSALRSFAAKIWRPQNT